MDTQELLDCGYVRWTGSVRPETKNADALLMMGYLEWTSVGRLARNHRIRELEISIGIDLSADMTAEEERTLP